MKTHILSVLFALASVLCAGNAERIPAVILAVLYLVFFFLLQKDITVRFLLLSAAGFPLVLAAGNPVFTGIVSLLLLASLLSLFGELSSKILIPAVIAALCAALCAFISSAITAIILAAVLVLIGIYILFITEYRLRKTLKVNPHDRT